MRCIITMGDILYYLRWPFPASTRLPKILSKLFVSIYHYLGASIFQVGSFLPSLALTQPNPPHLICWQITWMIKEQEKHFAFNFCWKYFNTVSFGSQTFNFRFCLCALSTRLVLPGALSIVNHIWQQTRRFRKFCTEARLVGKLLSWHMGIGRTTICDIKVTSTWHTRQVHICKWRKNIWVT